MPSYLQNHGRRLCNTLKLHTNGSGVRRHDGTDLKLFILVGWDQIFRLLLVPQGLCSFASDFQWCCFTDQESPSVVQHVVYVEPLFLLLYSI